MALPPGDWWRSLSHAELATVLEIEEYWGALALGLDPSEVVYQPVEKPDKRGRVRVTLPTYHPYAYGAGWQYRYRLLVMEALGRRLEKSEHVNHLNRRLADDRLENLEVIAPAYHGQLHAYALTVAGFRDDLGRFQEVEPGSAGEYWIERWGPILGPAALDYQPRT